jgi:hypothetical protein
VRFSSAAPSALLVATISLAVDGVVVGDTAEAWGTDTVVMSETAFHAAQDSVRLRMSDARTIPTLKRPGSVHEFYFTRAKFGSGFGSRWRPSWATDYPKADIQFLIGLRRLTNVDAYEFENAIDLDDPELRRFPFLYALEVGYMGLTESEVEGLRGYLQAGGFLMIDDFWGTWQWQNFASEMQRVLPGHSIVDVPMDHAIFSIFYNIDSIVQVPNVGLGKAGGRTWEYDGYYPQVRGIFDDDGRLMVAINWNTDLGDAWEWADDPYYPLAFSTYAYEVGINTVLYAMTH